MLKRILLHLSSVFFRWNMLIIVCVSLGAGFIIVTHGRPEKFSALIRIPGLLSSTLYSSVIAFVLLLMVYVVSFTGNAKFAGRGMNARWFRFQFSYGVLLTLLVELVLATILFALNGFWILDTAFFDKLFLPVVLFILLANVCYLLYFIQQVRTEVEVPIFVPVEVETIRYQPVPLVVAQQVDVAAELTDQEPALFYIYQGEVWIKDFTGKRSIWLKSLEKTMSCLDSRVYFKGSRNWIVHRKAITAIEPLSGRRIELQCLFKVRIKLVVSRRNAHDFKEWLYGIASVGPSAGEAVRS